MTPPIIARAGDLLARYDVLFCDVWGVVHNGIVAFGPACDALARFRARGGTVILLSNAPVPKARVADMLDSRKVPRSAWDAIVSSGDIALTHIAERGLKDIFCIGPLDRDAALFRSLDKKPVPLERAEAILCSGLNDDRTETAETYRPLLEEARGHNLPFICANPDLMVDVGGTLLLCAGVIADVYEHMGGEVYWAGKPHTPAYETAFETARRSRGAEIPKNRVLVIGDALRTDIKGAADFGVDALFIGSGIHRHDTMDGPNLAPAKLAKLFAPGAPPALAAMTELAW